MLILLRGAFFIGLIVLWLWCVFDVIRTDQEKARYLHKLVWLAFVLLIPWVGSLAWLFLGRPTPVGSRLIPPPRPSAPAPDDSPEFLARLDEEIKRRRRSEELRRRTEGNKDSGQDAGNDASVDDEISRMEQDFRDEDEGGAKG